MVRWDRMTRRWRDDAGRFSVERPGLTQDVDDFRERFPDAAPALVERLILEDWRTMRRQMFQALTVGG